MDVRPRNPLVEPERWETGPIRDYHVVFWRQPLAPEGIRQERTGWTADENDVLAAEDVHAVIEWAERESRARNAMYTLYAIVRRSFDDEGLVWLAGVNPCIVEADWNFDRVRP